MSSDVTRANEPSDANKTDSSLDNFTKNGFKSLTSAIRYSNALPSDNDWNFYKLNSSFCTVMNSEGNRLLQLMNAILKKYEIDVNINARQTIEDKVDLIVEANDAILEKVGDNLDELNGIEKKNVKPVELQTVTAQLPPTISGSWNRINKAIFSVTSSATAPREGTSSNRAIHLLTGKNIIRPQTYFKDKIDNSNTYPWQPRITEKPNSIRPLALFMEESEFGDTFCHPYQTELDQFQPPPEQLKPSVVSEPKPVSRTPLHKIESQDQLNELVEELRKHEIIAVDLEHHSYRTFMGFTCLMQISTVNADYIIDTLVLRDKLHVLNEIFTKPSIVKVFHGAFNDIQWLQRDLSLYVVNLFDTHIAAKQLDYPTLSLAYLLKRFCKFDPNKQFQLADWRIRPLPDELVHYAREDTHYLIFLYGVLKNALIKRANGADNLLKLVIKNSTEICKKRYMKPKLTDESHLDFYRKCKRLFDNRQMFALKELYQWRDKTARQEDESTGYVLPNHMLLQIAEMLPREMQGILACCNPIPPLVRSNLLELHQIVLKAREQSAEKAILKEDNRDMGSTQQFSKINIESSLHCPHDLTKVSDFRDDLPVLLTQPRMSVNEWKTVGLSKFNASLERKKSRYSIFDSPEHSNEDIEKQTVGMSNLKFLGPYERYKQVKPFIKAEEEKEAAAAKTEPPTDGDDKSTDDRIASLHEHFLKVAKVCPLPQQQAEVTKNHAEPEKTVAPPILGIKEEQTETAMSTSRKRKSEECLPLARMKGAKRKRTVVNQAVVDSSLETPANPLHDPAPNIGQFKKNKRKRPPKKERQKFIAQQQLLGLSNNNQAESETVSEREQPKHKKKKLRNKKSRRANGAQTQGKPKAENAAIEPFDYSSVDYRQFQGGAGSSGGGKPKYINSNFRGKSNKRFRGKRNNKSSTFNSDKRPKM